MAVSVDLTGRRALVTGASSGIGAEICRSIVGCAGSVAMLARRKERLDELHDELGERAIGIPCDVTDLDGLEAAVAEAARSLGGLDAVITVAGKAMAGGVITGSPQAWRDLINLNLVGPLATVRFAVPHFAAAGRRNVVFIGSAAAITPMPGTSAYSASKAGLRAAFESLRFELAAEGIGVTHVVPGFFETEGLTLEGIVIDGEVPQNDFPMLAPGAGPAAPEGVARSIAFALSLPDGVAINELVIRPTGQLNP